MVYAVNSYIRLISFPVFVAFKAHIYYNNGTAMVDNHLWVALPGRAAGRVELVRPRQETMVLVLR
jgi:hypothetical protein